MNKRLTQPMRHALQALDEGRQPVIREPGHAWDTSATVLSALRKRGFVTMRSDATFEITPQGREALAQANRSVN